MGIEKSAWRVLSLNEQGPGAVWALVGCRGNAPLDGRGRGGGQKKPAENEFGYFGDQFVAS